MNMPTHKTHNENYVANREKYQITMNYYGSQQASGYVFKHDSAQSRRPDP